MTPGSIHRGFAISSTSGGDATCSSSSSHLPGERVFLRKRFPSCTVPLLQVFLSGTHGFAQLRWVVLRHQIVSAHSFQVPLRWESISTQTFQDFTTEFWSFILLGRLVKCLQPKFPFMEVSNAAVVDIINPCLLNSTSTSLFGTYLSEVTAIVHDWSFALSCPR